MRICQGSCSVPLGTPWHTATMLRQSTPCEQHRTLSSSLCDQPVALWSAKSGVLRPRRRPFAARRPPPHVDQLAREGCDRLTESSMLASAQLRPAPAAARQMLDQGGFAIRLRRTHCPPCTPRNEHPRRGSPPPQRRSDTLREHAAFPDAGYRPLPMPVGKLAFRRTARQGRFPPITEPGVPTSRRFWPSRVRPDEGHRMLYTVAGPGAPIATADDRRSHAHRWKARNGAPETKRASTRLRPP
jgi:hypothetical protein